ncbi:MAG: aldehyde dehydrogenase, partial [Planctomycetes bacterium]|nr:aldehyde dehydrogenase [Planctomycetota bacterium]
MLSVPVLRWGKPYESLETDEIFHFRTGEPIAKVSRANGGLLQRDIKRADRARQILREFPCTDLIARIARAADSYESGTLPIGDGSQSPDDFVRQQSASTGLPEHMCRANMAKNSFVLKNMGQIL